MSEMFDGCYSLNNLESISKWDTKNVINMSGMFYGCGIKNNLEIMDAIFKGCSTKNIPENFLNKYY